ncbi:MAG: TetR/AcrR family transcriptional regulator [bacterium]|nr:TetR/AcrR family transcriptional regulator [bacterium]
MPRRSLAAERTTQILDAFEHCVVQHGLSGASLEMVAQTAGVQRSILRHYIGNRDDLIHAMAERLTARYRVQLKEMVDLVGDHRRFERLVDLLFATPSDEDFHDVVLAEALIAGAEHDAHLRELMSALVEETIAAVRDILRLEHPETGAQGLWEVAHGIVGIYFNHGSLHPLQLPVRHRSAARGCARRLLATLDG